MPPDFILVDFENVQPRNLGLLKPGACRIKVFVGASQSKILLELVQALQPFGSDAEYIQVVGSGKDALDFHIAFYIGRLAAGHPQASFTIISRDTGFDPLLKHLATLKIACRRVKAISDIPHASPAAVASAKPPAKATPRVVAKSPARPARKIAVEPNGATAKPPAKKTASKAGAKSAAKSVMKPVSVPTPARIDSILARLTRLKGRPGTVHKLRSSILSWIKPALSEAELDALLTQLASTGRIAISGAKVAYTLD